MSGSYKLDPDIHQSIYIEKIAARYLPKSKAQAQPIAVITGGQPGSGKSGITALAVARFRQSGYVLVDADKLRPRHPDYAWLMQNNDKLAANLTHPDCGAWASQLLRDGVQGRRNLIIDQTSRDPVALGKMTQQLRQAGYKVELHVMAVTAAISEQRIYQRYEGQRARDGFGRFSTKEKHDEAYAGVGAAVAFAEQNKQVDRLCLYDHTVTPIYENRLERGQWQKTPNAGQSMDAERSRPMTLQERRDYANGFDELAVMLAKPERQASEQEIRHIESLRQQAKVSLAAEVFRQESPETTAQQFPELVPALKVMQTAARHFETKMPDDAVAQRQALQAVRKHVQARLDQSETQDFRQSPQEREDRQQAQDVRTIHRGGRASDVDVEQEQ